MSATRFPALMSARTRSVTWATVQLMAALMASAMDLPAFTMASTTELMALPMALPTALMAPAHGVDDVVEQPARGAARTRRRPLAQGRGAGGAAARGVQRGTGHAQPIGHCGQVAAVVQVVLDESRGLFHRQHGHLVHQGQFGLGLAKARDQGAPARQVAAGRHRVHQVAGVVQPVHARPVRRQQGDGELLRLQRRRRKGVGEVQLRRHQRRGRRQCHLQPGRWPAPPRRATAAAGRTFCGAALAGRRAAGLRRVVTADFFVAMVHLLVGWALCAVPERRAKPRSRACPQQSPHINFGRRIRPLCQGD